MYSSLFILAFTVVGAIVNAKMARVATDSQKTTPTAGAEKYHKPYWNSTSDPESCRLLSQACTGCLADCYQHHIKYSFTTKDDCYSGQCNSTAETRFQEACVTEQKAKDCSDALPKALQQGGPALEQCCSRASGVSLY